MNQETSNGQAGRLLPAEPWLGDRRMLRKMENMRATKERKRLLNPPEREPKMVRYYPLEFGIRNKTTGETAWVDLKSVRDAAKRIGAVLKHY